MVTETTIVLESTVNVGLHYYPEANTVTDGDIKVGHYSFLEFPGVGICIPIVLVDGTTRQVVASVHANPLWSRKKLQETLGAMLDADPLCMYYLQRYEDSEQYLHSNDNRDEILNWLSEQSVRPNVLMVKTLDKANSYVQHYGFSSSKGFSVLTFE